MSARSIRQAWIRESIGRDGPSRKKCLSVLEDEAVFVPGPALGAGLFEVAFKAFKKILPRIGLCDEDVAPVALVANPAQIAERAQRIQGARDDRLGHTEQLGEAAYGMRSGGEIDQQHEGHLPVGEVGLSRPDIADQRLHPAPEGLVRHYIAPNVRLLFRSYNQSATLSF